MFTRFIVATDLSPSSFAIIEHVAALRKFGARKCLLLQCLDMQSSGQLPASQMAASLGSEMTEQKQLLESYGFATTTRVVPGPAKTEINRIAQEEGYSLVVVGSRGHTLVGEMLLGGVAEAIIHHARKPVLLLRLQTEATGKIICCQGNRCDFADHVLFPTDFSENAEHAFRFLEKIVADGAKRVTLLHVQDRTRIDPHLRHRLEEFNELDQGRLEGLKDRLSQKGESEIEIQVTFGHPFQEIVRAVRENAVRLVVMGSQGRGFVEEVFLGSVSHRVARHSDAPVMLIPTRRP